MRAHGGIPLCLLLLLSGCSSPQIEYRERPVIVDRVEYRSPPVDQSLLQGCEAVQRAISTNGDLLDAYIEANTRLRQCGANTDELRELLNGGQD